MGRVEQVAGAISHLLEEFSPSPADWSQVPNRARSFENWVTGYDYWLLVDYPAGSGEGDAWEEGWFDYFWRPKVASAEGRELNSAVLPMISNGLEDRTLWNEASKKISVSISNYGESAIKDGALSWVLNSDGQPIDAGEIPAVSVSLGAVSRAGDILLHAPAGKQSHKLQLIVNIKTQNTIFSNRWNFWSFPRTQLVSAPTSPVVATADLEGVRQNYSWLRDPPKNISADTLLITSRLTEAVRAHLRRGGRVIWILPPSPSTKGVSFLPASGGAFGTLLQQTGPLQEFPNEGFCDLQCFNLLDGATPIPLDAWPTELTPMIGAIRTKSDFLSPQKDLSRIGYIFEINAWGGKLLVTAPGIWKHLDMAHPEVVYLFDKLVRYASSESFAPELTIPDALMSSLHAEQ
jgi:hypothetical protein